MATLKDYAVEELSTLKTAFDAAVKDAQEDAKRWKWFRIYPDPKAREEEFAEYAQKTTDAVAKIAADDNAGAAETLKGLKADFDTVAAVCRAMPENIWESYFPLNAEEARQFDGYAASVNKVLKLL